MTLQPRVSLQHRMEALVEDLVGAPPTPLEEGSPPVEGAPSEAKEEETIIIIEGIEIRASAPPAPRHRPDLCRGTDASEGQHPRRDPGASKMTKVAAPSVLWRGALALEAEKAAARRQAAAAARAGRRARAIEGRRTASTRDPATTDAAASTLIDPCALTCSQLMETDGGEFGCILPAGHKGPHQYV